MHTERRRPRSVLVGLPWFPSLVAAAWVLNLWVETGVSALAVARSLAIAVGTTLLLTAVLAVLIRRPAIAGLVVLAGFGLLISRSPLHVVAIGVIAIVAWAAGRVWRRIHGSAPTAPVVGRALNLVGVILVAVILVTGVSRGTLAAVPRDVAPAAHPAQAADAVSAERPDIVILMLDGYPRADWLERRFGVTNEEFLAELGERGFEVAERSTSNYPFTQLTLSSMLHMKPAPDIEELQDVLAGREAGHPRLRLTINDNPAFATLRDAGYRVVAFGPGYEHVALRQADVYLDDGQLNDFEYELVRSTLLQPLATIVAPDVFAEQKRQRVRSGFRAFRELDIGADAPMLAFIHIPAPHQPVVFDEEGGPAPLPPSGDIYGTGEDDLLPPADYGRQLTFLNRSTLEGIDGLLAADSDRPLVLVVMSDHGARLRPLASWEAGTPGDYASLFAVRDPTGATRFPDDPSPVNLFPRLLNAHLGTDFRTWPDEPYPWIADP